MASDRLELREDGVDAATQPRPVPAERLGELAAPTLRRRVTSASSSQAAPPDELAIGASGAIATLTVSIDEIVERRDQRPVFGR